MSIMRAMSAALFTVHTTTAIPRLWDSAISAGFTSPKYGDQIAPPAALIAPGGNRAAIIDRIESGRPSRSPVQKLRRARPRLVDQIARQYRGRELLRKL